MNQFMAQDNHSSGEHWNRRRFLQLSALAVGAAGAVPLLASCGSSSAPAPVGAPQRGGTLRIGAIGGSDTDTLDPHQALNNSDFTRHTQLFDPLVFLDKDAQPKLSLAESVTPNNDGTEWIVKIHPGVVTHKGVPFTADDVLFSLRRIMSTKSPAAVLLGPIDVDGSSVVDPTTVRLKFSQPFAVLVDALSYNAMMMVPRGFDPRQPDGTGPFMYQSFTPGQQSTFVRNPHYWQNGLPYVDSVVTVDLADETTQVNALQSGQVDMVTFLTASSVNILKAAGLNVSVSQKTGSWGPLTMRVDQKPWSDVRVRQAVRLAIDRPGMLKAVFGGYGTIGNDVFGALDKNFPTDLPQRQQDVSQAKSLLASAGFPDLDVELVTAPTSSGVIQAAQVFATQAKQSGINVRITQQTTTNYFATSYLTTNFSQDYWPTFPYLSTVALAYGANAPYNACHFANPQFNQLYGQAIATLDDGKRKELIHDMAHLDYDEGAYAIPYYFPTIEASSTKVQGSTASANGFSPNGNDIANIWMTP